jgi:hypothetical protein
MVTINGTLKDIQTLKVIPNGIMQEIYYESDGNILTPFGPIYNINNGTWTLTVDVLSSDRYFQFSAPGYNIYYANLTSLYNDSNVQLLTSSHSAILPIAAIGLFLLAAKKKKHVAGIGKMETKDVMPYILIGGVLVAAGLLKKFFTSLGILDSADTTALNNADTNPQSFWNPNYWKQFSSFPNGAITTEQAVNYLLQITDAFGFFSDNVAAVDAVFHQLTSKAQVSYMSYVSAQNGGSDLLTYLRGSSWPNDRLSDSEVQAINSFLNNLPTN